MNLKTGKVFTSKFVGTGPLSYKKRIYRAAVPQKLRNTGIGDWVDLRTVVDVSQNRNILVLPGFDPSFTVAQHVAYSLHTHTRTHARTHTHTHSHTHTCIYMHGKG